jgi:hypothetical protein
MVFSNWKSVDLVENSVRFLYNNTLVWVDGDFGMVMSLVFL